MAYSTETRTEDRDVLVVEDDPEINKLVGAYVELAGFHYLAALNGAEAFAQIRRHCPLAVVLDLMLPDVNGLEICRRLKNDVLTRDVAIIILTALDSDDTRAQGLGYGASQYLTKPFDPEQLLDALNRLAPASASNN